MSRHRHVRNMRYEDYMDDYDDDMDDYDYDEPDPEPGPSAASQPPPPPEPPAPADDALLDDLVAQFRAALRDDALPPADIDAAIVAADYDVDAALDLLRAHRRAADAAAARRAARLELRAPSPIARMLAPDLGPTPPPPLPPAPPLRLEPIVALDPGAALRPADPADAADAPGAAPAPFQFDAPSPDDLVRLRQARAGPRAAAVRLPKASVLRAAAPRAPAAPAAAQNAAKPRERPPAAKSSEAAAASAPKPHKPRRQRGEPAPKVKQRLRTVDLSARKKALPSVAVVVAGHVDAGKSTLLCHFLQLLEEQASGKRRRRKLQELAWGTDEDAVERERGVTIDIATRIFRRNRRAYAMIDSPGHRDFVPAMILGAAQASAALLVVDSSPGEFEAGFSERGQTREHALVLRSLGVTRLVVVVNKMDVADWSEQRFREISRALRQYLQSNGWKVTKSVSFIPASGREGVNLVSRPNADHPLTEWYGGRTLLEEIERIPGAAAEAIEKDSAMPTRLVVSDFFRSTSLGGDGAVTGRLMCGTIAPKDKLAICPGGVIATVKNLEVGSERATVAVAGADSLPVSIGLQDLTDGIIISTGNVLSDPESPVRVAKKFRAQIVTTGADALVLPGTQAVLHVGGGAEAASVVRLVKYVNGKRAGKVPRRLVKGDCAEVEIVCERGVAMERSADVKGLGRFALRENGMTAAVGVVLDILETVKIAEEEDRE